MLYIKQICLIIFLIITILFTVGYASQPIIETSHLAQPSTSTNGNPSTSSKVSSAFYLSKVSRTISNAQNTYSGSYNVSVLFQTLLYTCIAITILLVGGILLGHFGLKMISKIIFLIVMILMIIVFIIIQTFILADSFLSNVKNSDASLNSISDINTSNGTGYYLILVSTVLMIITYLIYAILA